MEMDVVKTKQAAEAEVAALAEGKGRYVLVSAQEGKTRVYLKDLKKDTKKEQFKMFCISWDKFEKGGLYIAAIEDFRIDKNNHVYMVVKAAFPMKGIKNPFMNNVLHLAFLCGSMWKPYGKVNMKAEGICYNEDAALTKFGCDLEDRDKGRMELWEKLTDGTLTAEEVERAFNMKPDWERNAKLLQDMFRSGIGDTCPMLEKRMARDNMNKKDLEEFCKKEHEAYVKLGFSGAANIAEEAEAVISHYVKIREAEKAEKKAKKAVEKSGM